MKKNTSLKSNNLETKEKLNLKDKFIDYRMIKRSPFLWYNKKLHKSTLLEKSNFSNKKTRLNTTTPQKHFVPSNKEWNQSIYAYNKQTVKNLPCFDKAALKLVESYVNMYDYTMEDHSKSKKRRIRHLRRSFRKVMTAKLNFKQTNKAISITVYVHNKRIRFFFNKMSKTPTIDKLSRKDYNIFVKNLKSKLFILKNFLQIHKDKNILQDILENFDNYKEMFNNKKTLVKFCKENQLINTIFNGIRLRDIYKNSEHLQSLFLDRNKLEKIFNVYIDYIDHFLDSADDNLEDKLDNMSPFEIYEETLKEFTSLETESIIAKQFGFVEKLKFHKFYLLPLIKLFEWVYKKKVQFNFINLKYIQYSASILAQDVKAKLEKSVYVSSLKKTMLDMTRLTNRKLIYARENKQHILQNIIYKNTKIKTKSYNSINDKLVQFINRSSKDKIGNYDEAFIKEFNKNIIDNSDYLQDPLEKFINNDPQGLHYYRYNTYKIFKELKYKYLTAVHLRISGRISKRFTAARSVLKKDHRGNLKNIDSSYKGLSTSLVRGFVISSVQYGSSNGLRRTGSYNVKIWTNSN